MNVPWFLITSTRGAPSGTSISTPSRVSLATEAVLLPVLARCAGQLSPLGLAGDLGVGAGRRPEVLATGLCLDEIDDRSRRLEAVGVGELVFLQVLVGEPRQLVLVVVHIVEPVDGVAEGAAGLDRLVGAGFRAEAAIHADAEVDLVAHLVEAAVLARLGGDEDATIRAGLGAGAAAGAALVEPEQAG